MNIVHLFYAYIAIGVLILAYRFLSLLWNTQKREKVKKVWSEGNEFGYSRYFVIAAILFLTLIFWPLAISKFNKDEND